MFFSIIVPVYNVEEYLKQCLDTILNQTFKDFEVILINDGSTDNSGKICDKYKELDARIKVIHKKNGGQSEARNVGLKESKGKYIIFIDSDDYIKTDKFLEKIHKECESNVDIVLYKYQKYYEDTNRMEKCHFNFPKEIENSEVSTLIVELVKTDSFYCSPWSKCIKSNLLKDNQIEFEVGLIVDDLEWYYNVISVTKSIRYIDESFIIYRQRSGSITSSWKIKTLTDFLKILEKWTEYISNEEINEKLKYGLGSNLAKQYCNLFIGYSRINDIYKKNYINRIKKLDHLLRYKDNKRVRIIGQIYKILGFNGTIGILKLIEKVKRK